MNAPEKIWIEPAWAETFARTDGDPVEVEYTRTDLAQSSVAAALEAAAVACASNGKFCDTMAHQLDADTIRALITPDQRTALQAAIDAAKAEARAEDAAWFPMETAPRDGTWFLAYSAIPGFDRIRHVHFSDAYDRFPINSENIAWPRAPTHWRPLPAINQIGAKP